MPLLSTRNSSSRPSQPNEDPEEPPRRSPRRHPHREVYLLSVSRIILRHVTPTLSKWSLTPLPSPCSSLSKRIPCRVVGRIFPEHEVDEVSRSCLKPRCGSHCLGAGPPWPPVTWPCPPAPTHRRVRRAGRGCHCFPRARPAARPPEASRDPSRQCHLSARLRPERKGTVSWAWEHQTAQGGESMGRVGHGAGHRGARVGTSRRPRP